MKRNSTLKQSTPTALTLGLDLGDRVTHCCWLDDEKGNVQGRTHVPTTTTGLSELMVKLKPSRVVMEVGTHSPWVSELVGELPCEVIVANPRKVKAIYAASNKSDRVDAEMLARMGRFDKSLLAPIQHRGKKAREALAVLRSRDTLVKTRVKLIASVRGQVKASGSRLPSCSTDAFHKKIIEDLPEALHPALLPIIYSIETISEQIIALEKQLQAMSKEEFPETNQLTQINGVGLLTALAFVLVIDDPNRFSKSRDVAPYIGLVPRRDQSGKSDKQLGITKTGDPLLRRLLVQCAHLILRSNSPDSDLKRWGLKLSERGGKNAKKRAVVATARKLSVLMHRLWMSGETYQAVGHSKQQEKSIKKAA